MTRQKNTVSIAKKKKKKKISRTVITILRYYIQIVLTFKGMQSILHALHRTSFDPAPRPPSLKNKTTTINPISHPQNQKGNKNTHRLMNVHERHAQ